MENNRDKNYCMCQGVVGFAIDGRQIEKKENVSEERKEKKH